MERMADAGGGRCGVRSAETFSGDDEKLKIIFLCKGSAFKKPAEKGGKS